MEPQHRMAELFDSVADTYDAVGVDLFQPAAAGLVRALEPQAGERALDVGCGRGAVLFPLAEAVTASGHVTGIDVSPRNGGRVGVSTFGPYDDQWREQVDATLAPFRPPEARDARTTGAQGPFASDEGMEQLLADAGFRDVRTVSSTVSPRFEDAAHWQRWSMSVGQRQFWEAIEEDRRAEVEAACFAAVERCRKPDGRLGFDQQIRYTIGRR